jgi:hypothetical protein
VAQAPRQRQSDTLRVLRRFTDACVLLRRTRTAELTVTEGRWFLSGCYRKGSQGSQDHGGLYGDDAYSGACKCSPEASAGTIAASSGRPVANCGPYAGLGERV